MTRHDQGLPTPTCHFGRWDWSWVVVEINPKDWSWVVVEINTKKKICSGIS